MWQFQGKEAGRQKAEVLDYVVGFLLNMAKRILSGYTRIVGQAVVATRFSRPIVLIGSLIVKPATYLYRIIIRIQRRSG